MKLFASAYVLFCFLMMFCVASPLNYESPSEQSKHSHTASCFGFGGSRPGQSPQVPATTAAPTTASE
ncbi:unnamed protein product [Callosobruchus maculatus]|uniref:Secreted protein n=1 Tax=Callosobruchus maculatus TaxID=64391 RepID=A0A653CE27_CALMS|nr:unnamed protein product [Callosobruchus maculatus]